MRSFARLEHLKRHERSHTKEKPFECPECTRCFARRDLLLRHQQKLHSSTTPSSRPRSGRRESVAGVASGRVRKNSVANPSSGMRPRANTLSHVDTATLGMLANTNPAFGRFASAAHQRQFNELGDLPTFHVRSATMGHHHTLPSLPKLETELPTDISGGLRTAPPFGGFGTELGMNALAFGAASANTINPHALHWHGIQGLGTDGPSAFHQYYGNFMNGSAIQDDEQSLEWMAQGFENQMSFAQGTENAIDDSSPSAMSTNSPPAVSDLMMDSNHSIAQNMHNTPSHAWQTNLMNQNHVVHSPSQMDYSTMSYSDMVSAPAGTISPKSLLAQSGLGLDMNLSSPPGMSATDSTAFMPEYGGPPFHLPLNRTGGESTASNSSMDSSLRHSSVTTMSGELVNDQIRNILIAGLSQQSCFGQRKYSQPSISSPLSPNSGQKSKGFAPANFPSTLDLQRYVSAYIQYFHPHLPFLHIPTLNFDSLDYSMPLATLNGHPQYGQVSMTGGGSCLVLSIAAIGALYEHEMNHSKELFESAKRLISCYLEERRKANLTRAQFGPSPTGEVEDTPLWLVQAMLLNVIYGHNCGDKTAADIASNHCAALVSLARGAELAKPPAPQFPYGNSASGAMHGQHSQMNGVMNNGWNSLIVEPDDSDWRNWKVVEERKRTLYAVFILSSLLVSAYNHPPALTNSEIRLELPCDEELWSADNAQTWRNMGGSAVADSQTIMFSAALGHLLTAAQRQQRRRNSTHHQFGMQGEPADGTSDLKPSTFGCLILVNALHNYIWETRQRHLGRQWTAQETEQMHAHIEPALRAWQAAWASNPRHSLERPNPFGAGPLSADSIPLLDLAYVRLFVNLGRSKEAFWQRDWDAMARELAKGPEGMQTAEPNQAATTEMPPPPRRQSQGSPQPASETSAIEPPTLNSTLEVADSPIKTETKTQVEVIPTTRRERHLRKAAFYATDSLAMADKLGLTFADHTSRELPLQSAMCAFDCAQVCAEWMTTLQERVGKYLGIIGKDEMDLLQVPGILLLDDEDRRLLEKVDVVLRSAEQKMSQNSGNAAKEQTGFGSRILMLTAQMLERAAVWPGKLSTPTS